MAKPTKRKFPDCPTPFSDHVFKVAHGVDVPLRVWAATAGEGPRPWVLWFHGGGFTFGKHYHPNPWVLPAFRSRGYHVVSAAYRFFPHVSLWDVIEDSHDAFDWCRANLSDAINNLDGGEVDVDRYVTAGDSMGGLLATLAGHNFSPRPKAVAGMYPFTHPEDAYFHPPEGHPFEPILRQGEPGDASGARAAVKAQAHLGKAVGDSLAPMPPKVFDFVSKVDAEYKRRAADPNYADYMSQPKTPKGGSVTPPKTAPTLPTKNAIPAMASLPISGTYTPMELYTYLCSRDLSSAFIAGAFRHELPPVMDLDALRAYWGMPSTWVPEHPILQGDAMVFEYAARLMIRTGGRRELYGTDEEWFTVLKRISAVAVADERGRVAKKAGNKLEYPPTFLIHGTADTTVPCYHSERLAAVLKEYGVPVQEWYAPGQQHNFDLDILDSSNRKWDKYIAPCLDFVDHWCWTDKPKGAVGPSVAEQPASTDLFTKSRL